MQPLNYGTVQCGYGAYMFDDVIPVASPNYLMEIYIIYTCISTYVRYNLACWKCTTTLPGAQMMMN